MDQGAAYLEFHMFNKYETHHKQYRRKQNSFLLTLIYLATALVDIPAVSMRIAHFLNTLDICDIVVTFYCPPAQGAPVY